MSFIQCLAGLLINSLISKGTTLLLYESQKYWDQDLGLCLADSCKSLHRFTQIQSFAVHIVDV